MGKAKITVYETDLSEELQHYALQVASLAFNQCKNDLDMACYITEQFEKRQGGTWTCLVGNFVGYGQYQWNGYIRFSFDDKMFTVFKSA